MADRIIITLDPKEVSDDPAEQKKLTEYIDEIIYYYNIKNNTKNTMDNYIDSESEIFMKDFVQAYITAKRACDHKIMDALEAFGKIDQVQNLIDECKFSIKRLGYLYNSDGRSIILEI